MRVRPLSTHAEFAVAVRLQREIWGFDDVDLLPVRLFVVASHVGGQVLGAFDGHKMVGFLLAVPGVKPTGRPYLHSHMTGVLPAYQNSGAGRMLKLAQRDDALARGFRLIEWTFDPFNSKNAYFNLERLGAVVTEFIPNAYGTTTSPLHAGLPTDRCVAQWWIRRTPPGNGRRRDSTALSVPLPDERTLRSQRTLARNFRRALAQGLTAVGFERKGAGVYLFAPWRPPQ